MASSYLYPGIYIEEVPGGTRPVEAISTSIAAFLGEVPNAEGEVNRLVWINNWTEFTSKYVSGGSSSTALSHAVYGFFQNGGGRCCVINLGVSGSLAGDGKTGGIHLLEEVDEISIVAAPGYSSATDFDTVLNHCEKMRNRVAIFDCTSGG